MSRQRYAAIAVALVLIAMAPSGTHAAATGAVYASPAEVFAAYQKAERAGDSLTFEDCNSADVLKEEMAIAVDAMEPDPTTAPSTQPADAKVIALEKKYEFNLARRPGESDELVAQRVAGQIKDCRAFLIDADGLFSDKMKASDVPPSGLINVQIGSTGTTATAKVVRHDPDGSSMSQDIKFKLIDGSWKIDSMIGF